MATRRFGQLVVATCGCEDDERCGCVVIASSVASVLMSLAGAVLLVALSIFWLASGGPAWVGVLFVIGVAVVVVVLVDMPVLSVFTEAGVTRRVPLRDHALPWDRIDGLAPTQTRRRPGLVAHVGRRKYLLADRVGLTNDQISMLSSIRPHT